MHVSTRWCIPSPALCLHYQQGRKLVSKQTSLRGMKKEEGQQIIWLPSYGARFKHYLGALFSLCHRPLRRPDTLMWLYPVSEGAIFFSYTRGEAPQHGWSAQQVRAIRANWKDTQLCSIPLSGFQHVEDGQAVQPEPQGSRKLKKVYCHFKSYIA